MYKVILMQIMFSAKQTQIGAERALRQREASEGGDNTVIYLP